LAQHEQTLAQVEKDLAEHREFVPEKGSKPRVIQDYLDKETYLEFEVFSNSIGFSNIFIEFLCCMCFILSCLSCLIFVLNLCCVSSFFIFDMFH